MNRIVYVSPGIFTQAVLLSIPENSDVSALPLGSCSDTTRQGRENLEALKVLEFKIHIHFGIWRLRQAVAEVGPEGEGRAAMVVWEGVLAEVHGVLLCFR